MLAREKWSNWPRDIRYKISSYGNVIGPSGRKLRLRIHPNGYLRFSYSNGAKCIDVYVHRAVCETFIGPANGCHCDHINCNRADNRLSNLRWLSPEQNRERRVFDRGENSHRARLSAKDVESIREASGTQKSIADRFGVSREHVRDIRSGKERKYG